MYVFDTHAHLYDERYRHEGVTVTDVLSRASEANVKRILIPADSIGTSRKAIDLVRRYDGTSGVSLYCSAGVHPHEASSWNDETEQRLRDMLDKREEYKIRAVGEIGLDYHYDYSPRDVQKLAFRRQLQIAYEYDMPIILHEREATGDCMEILRNAHRSGELRRSPGVCHCCSASAPIALELLRMGFFIGVDGPVTFKNNRKTVDMIDVITADRIVIETDSPYLTPEPLRGRINEPEHVVKVLEKVAQLKGVGTEEMMWITTANANRLYELEEEK